LQNVENTVVPSAFLVGSMEATKICY